MTQYLLRRFVRGKDAATAHAAAGTLAGVLGLACNCVLCALKMAMGLVTGSISLVADAMNNLTDASSSAITLIGFRMAQRPADEHHPYGHARYEYISGFVVATLILLIGIELGESSLRRILNPAPMRFSLAALVIMVLSMLLKGWMSIFYRTLGREIRSSSLQASAVDSRSDVLATAAVLLGSLLNRFLGVNVDGWVGLAVAVFIFISGVGVARETISPLLGKHDEKLAESIRAVILRHENVLGVHDLLVHDYGPGRYFASAHAELSADEDPQLCHQIIDNIERDALKELGVSLVIHYDPIPVDDAERAECEEMLWVLLISINYLLAFHDLRLVRTSGQTKLVFDLEVPFNMDMTNEEIKEAIDEALRAQGDRYRAVIRFDGRR